jgi:hypothetical protein
MGEFRRIGPEGIAALLPTNSRAYVSIDVDAMDMSLVPGCVSAEPNGMSYAELRDSLKAIAERHDIAGFDFVEVNPARCRHRCHSLFRRDDRHRVPGPHLRPAALGRAPQRPSRRLKEEDIMNGTLDVIPAARRTSRRSTAPVANRQPRISG